MEIRAVKIDGFGNINDLELDLGGFDKSLIAVAGSNGSGKTHLVEAMLPVALFRKLLSYDELVQEHFSSSGGRIETLLVHNGKKYSTIISGKYRETPLCYLFEEGACIAGPGVREFDEAVSVIFPPRQLLLASSFAPQNSVHGFFDMTQKDRHVAFAHMMGLSDYDDYIEIIKEKIKESRSEHKVALIIHEKLYEAAQGIEELDHEKLKDLKHCLEVATSTVERLERDIIPEIDKNLLLAREDLAKRKSAEDLVNKHTKALQYANGKAGYVWKIEALEAEVKKLGAEMDRLLEEENRLRASQKLAIENLDKAKDEANGLRDIGNAIMLDIKDQYEQYIAIRRKYTKALEKKDAMLKRMENVDTSHEMCKKCPLTANARQVIYDFEKAKQISDEAQSVYCAAIEKLTDRLNKVQAEYLDMVEAENAAADVVKKCCDDIARWSSTIASCDSSLALAKEELSKATSAHSSIPVLKKLLEEGELELKRTNPNAETQLRQATEELSAKTKELHLRKTEISELSMKIMEMESEEEQRKKALKELEEARIEVDSISGREAVLADLRGLIARDRRAQIDYVMPTIQRLCNSMLSSYQGGRFSVQMGTMKKKRSSDERREDFTPTILDMASEFPRQKGSVGESAIISEALRMSIAIAMHPGSGHEGTLIRDEVAGNVDVENLDTYMDILRYGLRNHCFKNEIFVCHMPHIIDRADAIVRMVKGKIVTVEA